MESHLTAAPTFEVHGIVGGYTGPGIKTIVPHRAEAKLSTRLVPDQKPAKVFKLIKRFVKKRLPDAERHARGVARAVPGADWTAPYNDAAAAAMRATFGKRARRSCAKAARSARC